MTVKRYEYFYVYDTCGSTSTGHNNKASQMIYIGNGRIKFFECTALDIVAADKKLAEFLEIDKINWNVDPFVKVVAAIEEIKPPYAFGCVRNLEMA